MIEIKSMEWADEMTGVDLMMPSQIKEGMRLARHVRENTGGFHTALIPVWDIGYANGRHLYRLCTGELVTATGADRLWVETEAQFPPPLDTQWITNEKFYTDFDRAFMERSRVIRTWTHPETAELYELRHGRSRPGEERWDCMRVMRTADGGGQWFAPSRHDAGLTLDQWDAIVEGRGW